MADGYFDAEKEQMIIADINEKKPDLLLVGIGFQSRKNGYIITSKTLM